MADRHDTTPRPLGKLREFSNQLAERLRTAPQAADQTSRLAVRMGERGYLVDMSLASEIVPLGAIAAVPWTRSWYRGLINVRGRLVGVVDLDGFAGRHELVAADSQQALVFGEALGINAALVVSRAFGLRSLTALRAIPAAGESPAWERGHWLDADGSMLIELDLRALVKTPAFAMIGA
ncbi:MAG: chemotaxis protein CheW [Burkholderiaceae bacterium]